jgi:hypothetical protein
MLSLDEQRHKGDEVGSVVEVVNAINVDTTAGASYNGA